jgi:hypothetical protein
MMGNDCAKPFGILPIVGVVRDSRTDLRSAATPAVFFPLGAFQGPVPLIVRTSGDPALMIQSVRRAMTDLNANTPTFSEAPVTDLVERRLRRERLLSSLLTVFAAVAVFICSLGIYGLLSYGSGSMASGDQRQDGHRGPDQRRGEADGKGVARSGRRWAGRRRRLVNPSEQMARSVAIRRL